MGSVARRPDVSNNLSVERRIPVNDRQSLRELVPAGEAGRRGIQEA